MCATGLRRARGDRPGHAHARRAHRILELPLQGPGVRDAAAPSAEASEPDPRLYAFMVRRLALAIRRADADLRPPLAGWGTTARGVTRNRSIEAHWRTTGSSALRRGPGERGSGGRRPPDRRERERAARGQVATAGACRWARGRCSRTTGRSTRPPSPTTTATTGRGPACVGGGRAPRRPRGRADGARVRQRRRRRRVRGPRPLRPGGRRVGRSPRGGGDALGLARRRAPPDPHAPAIDIALDARVLLRPADALRAARRHRRVRAVVPHRLRGGPRTALRRHGQGARGQPAGRSGGAAGTQDRRRSPTPTTRSSPPRCRSARPASANRVMLSVPGEMTVELGRRTRAAALAAMAGSGLRRVVVAGYANEYMSYLTTPEEYEAQHYEGGTTVYGPASGAFVAAALGGPGRAARPRRRRRPSLPVRSHARAAARRPGISGAARPRAASCASRARPRRLGRAVGLLARRRRRPRPPARAGVRVGPAPRTRRAGERGRRPWPAHPLAGGRRPAAGARHPGARLPPARHLPGLVGAAPARPGRAATASWSRATRYRLASRPFTLRARPRRCGSRGPSPRPGPAGARAPLSGGGARARPHDPSGPREERGR